MPPIDIKNGDILVVDGQEYPIKYAAFWMMTPAELPSFRVLTHITADTLRSPGIVDGKRGEPEYHLVGLRCTPLDPVDPDIKRRLGLDTPHTILETHVADQFGYMQVVVEDLKR